MSLIKQKKRSKIHQKRQNWDFVPKKTNAYVLCLKEMISCKMKFEKKICGLSESDKSSNF